MKLFIANLDWAVTEKDLINHFAANGLVAIDCAIVMDRETGRSKGFGFVTMETREEAACAIRSLSDTEILGRKLVVTEARSPKDRPTRERSSRGNVFRENVRENHNHRY